jgi:hypothetical protein
MLALDLDTLDPRTLAAYRADLRAVDPYTGTTRFGPGLFPDTFATTRDGVTYLGVVNRETVARNILVPSRTLGLEADSYTALEVATGNGRRVSGEFTVAVPAQSFRLLVLRPSPGLLWTDSVMTDEVVDVDAGLMAWRATGPVEAPGFVQIAAPASASILVDGVPATPASSADAILAGSGESSGPSYIIDEAAGILTVGYSHGGARAIEIRW